MKIKLIKYSDSKWCVHDESDDRHVATLQKNPVLNEYEVSFGVSQQMFLAHDLEEATKAIQEMADAGKFDETSKDAENLKSEYFIAFLGGQMLTALEVCVASKLTASFVNVLIDVLAEVVVRIDKNDRGKLMSRMQEKLGYMVQHKEQEAERREGFVEMIKQMAEDMQLDQSPEKPETPPLH